MPPTANRQDILYIAIMGVTGAGKSTFIQHCTGQNVPVGHGLQSCTQKVQMYDCWLRGVHIRLVDTPGFDDTDRSDTEVLTDVASWLTSTYSHNTKLRGIIYLHRITDRRMQGSAKKNLVMFKKLCGEEALRHVILATTMWENIDPKEGIRREQELKETEDFWGAMLRKGSRVERHTNDKDSALRLLMLYVTPGPAASDFVVDIQKQMVDQKLQLNQTAAGQSLQEELNKEREKAQQEISALQQDMADAIKMKDVEMERDLRAAKQDMDQKLQKMNQEQTGMNKRMQEEHERKLREFEQILTEQKNAALEQRRAADTIEIRNRSQQLYVDQQRAYEVRGSRMMELLKTQAVENNARETRYRQLFAQREAVAQARNMNHRQEMEKLQQQLGRRS